MRTKLKTRIMTLGAIGVVGVVGVGIDINNVGALSYQKNVDVGFKLEPSVSIKLSSSELTISDLAPGQSADSNIITLKVESNNANGYTVGSTVGGTKNEAAYNNSNLQHSSNYDSTKSISYFQSLSTSDEVADLADLTAGKWGYSFNLNNGSWSSYSGLPFNDGETASAELVNVGTNAESSIQFKIAAAAQDQQYSGKYGNVVNFAVTSNPAPKTLADAINMQDIFSCSDTLDGATNTLTDIRDGETYTVAKINGNCWMTQNLRYEGDTGSVSGSMIMKSATSNITTDKTIYYTDLTSGNSTAEARIHVATSSQIPSGATYTATDMGVWYNYPAASAKTITFSSSAESTSNLCPKNWTLPTASQQYSVTSYLSDFSPVAGGDYVKGSLISTDYGLWWSATAYSDTYRYNLYYSSNSNSLYIGNRGIDWGTGCYIRCIYTSQPEM